MTTIAYWLLILSGLWLIAVGVFICARPLIALQYLGKMASTNLINYTEISLRMISGFAFVIYEELSRFPEVLRISGWFLIISSAILFLIPRRWHAAYAVYWSKKLTPLYLRIASPFSLAAGTFLIFAAISRG